MSQPRHLHHPSPPPASAVERQAAEVAVALAKLRCLGTAVQEIGAALRLAPSHLARAEARDSLQAVATLPVAQLRSPAFAHLDEWFALFGDDLTLSFSLRGLDADASPVAAHLSGAVAELQPRALFDTFAHEAAGVAATQGDDVAVEARVALGKTRARAAAATLLACRPEHLDPGQPRSPIQLLVYYQAAALNASLSLRTLLDWEDLGIFTADGRTTLVVCDAAGYLAGLALEVVGASAPGPPDWLSVSRVVWRQFLHRAEASRQMRAAEGAWPGAPRALTPERLRLVAYALGLESTAECVSRAQSQLAAAYLATAVEREGDATLWLRFSGPRPASCRLDITSGSDQRASQSRGLLARLAAWAFRDCSSAKLLIARECLARELPAGGTVTLADLESAAGPALEAAKANLVLYVRSNIEQYFAVRQRAQDAVAAYAETVRKGVGDLASDAVDNIYRTVGVLAAALLAGLLQPSASLGALRLACGLYAIYVAFVLGVVLRSRFDRLRLERAALADRLAAMPELTSTERDRLCAPARAAEHHFHHYFWLASGLYAALGILALVLFVLLWTPLAPSLVLPHVDSAIHR
jgi:hypothetical protein